MEQIAMQIGWAFVAILLFCASCAVVAGTLYAFIKLAKNKP